MGYIIIALCVLFTAVCAIGAAQVDKKSERGAQEAPSSTERERAREAYYMNNFWSYDGSEQQEWDAE